jgi:ABC-2 type transport system permease protein
MSKTLAVIKREFTESVRTRTFLIGTILGPVFMIGLFAVQFLIVSRSGGGEHTIAIVDATGQQIGEQVEGMLGTDAAASRRSGARATFTPELITIAAAEGDARRAALNARIVAGELDGFVFLPPDLIEGGIARYEGENATNNSVTTEVRNAVQQAVQSVRLEAQGFDAARVNQALRPVRLETAKTGDDGATGSAEVTTVLAFLLGFAIYMSVLLYGASVMNGVLEEKRDRIVELIISSIRAEQLMLGKVVGIGATGVLQMAIWVAFAALLIMNAASLARIFNASDEIVLMLSQGSLLPSVPATVGILFVVFFAGGFFLYSTMYAVLGAIATTSQEAQQLVFPIIMPLILGFFLVPMATQNPDGGPAVIGSIVPFTSPMVMPVRAMIGGVPPLQLMLSIALLLGTGMGIVWIGGKIYRIGILATGKRPSMREVWRWVTTAA